VDGFHSKEDVARMPYRKLGSTGLEVSALSLGASSLGSVFHETDEFECVKVVETAIKRGVNLIDVAPWYGHGKAENVLGKALAQIPRKAYILATKVGRYDPKPQEMFDFSRERVLKSVDESLQRLGVEYVDIIQVHDLEFCPLPEIIIDETLPALQEVVRSGKARFIGITGYPLSALRSILESSCVKVDTVLSYCHYSLDDTSLVRDFLPNAASVGVINASPLSMGLLTNRGKQHDLPSYNSHLTTGPPSWHPATAEIKRTCAAAASFCSSQGVDISRLAVFFSTDNAAIPTTLVSTARLSNLEANLDVVLNGITATEKAVLDKVIEQFMVRIRESNWENREVEEYWQALGKELWLEKKYKKSIRRVQASK